MADKNELGVALNTLDEALQGLRKTMGDSLESAANTGDAEEKAVAQKVAELQAEIDTLKAKSKKMPMGEDGKPLFAPKGKAKKDGDEEAEEAKAGDEVDAKKDAVADVTGIDFSGWPRDLATKSFREGVEKKADPLTDWGKDPWADAEDAKAAE